ncbi:alpha-N-arabinofuranosidase [Clostridium beijerinckii]|uniref:non-reducing end alpha-L-arabinofuranosidase n=1 Tax=Clostridium beijerinckii TaxID=1520 RepID=A0A0B5QC10_CLOBE|nr:alpha-N-arabinofuranosidase [Clostridium beijerinckii]AJG99739.1 alpha-N-arabinofuranosidase [Clostridium beijerinckii]
MSKLVVNTHNKKSKINKEIYGHFSEHLGRCIYEGIYVGENSKIPNVNGMRCDVVEALKEIKIPVLRWPGGCFADEYHWKDGIGPKDSRKKMVNTHWGGVVEDNSFGTHEFMELCKQLNCEPYINGNVGSGSVQEMSEWIEYLTFDGISPMAELRKQNGQTEPWKVKFFGVGNENWGCGGNMTPEFYGNMYRRYQTYCRNYGQNKLYKIACGPNIDDYDWTEGVMKVAANFMDAFTLHYYTHPGGWLNKGPATGFDEKTWYISLNKTLKIEELINNHLEIMNRYDPERRVDLIIDEWGGWYDVEPGTNPGFLYQQNTMRDALIAGINLNIFNKHSDRVKMANLAQVVNVLQSVILTEGDKMILTPTYYVFDMYKNHQEATLIESYIDTKKIGIEEENLVPNLHESASIDDQGRINITINNLSIGEDYNIEGIIVDKQVKSVQATILTSEMGAHNTFDNPEAVKPEKFTKFVITDKGLDFTIPACSVISFILE